MSRLRTVALLGGTVAGMLLAASTACLQPPAPAQKLPELDFAYYVCAVDPILAQGCSYTNCHGQQIHALRVYSLGKLRYDLTLDAWHRANKPLGQAEINGNYNSAQSFFTGLADPQQSLLLREPLPAAEGGVVEHYGGTIWTGTNDPRYQAILAWAKNDKTAEQKVTSQPSCQALLKVVGQ